jgi:hypothetical protein
MTDENGPGPEYHEMMNDLNREHGLPYTVITDINGYDVKIDVREATMSFTAEKKNSCVIEGTIKWDGCSNWDFNADGVMPHFCGFSDVLAFHAMMVGLYELAAEHIKLWDAEMAE